MDQNDRDWEKELSASPLQGRGFDDRLRRRIEEQLDRKQKQGRRWIWPAAGFCGVLGLSLFVLLANPLGWGMEQKLETAAAVHSAAQPLPVPGPEETAASIQVKTGVLIGLRQDYAISTQNGELGKQASSSYRTLMLAPVNGQVSVAAEGSGILVPFGMKFWKIDAITYSTDTDKIHYLTVHPADKEPQAHTFIDNREEKVLHSEKLLFAGNQYLSVAEEEKVLVGDRSASASTVWVRKLNQMPERPAILLGSGGLTTPAESNVSIEDIFGEGASQVLAGLSLPAAGKQREVQVSSGSSASLTPSSTEIRPSIDNYNWAITRQPGRWVAQVARPSTPVADTALEAELSANYSLVDYPAALPETVTSHDKVSGTWGQIKALQPGATDLLFSPLEDLLIVRTDKELVLYAPGANIENSKPLLNVELGPGEQLVSAQWATGSYVPDWIAKARKYLQGTE